MKRVLPLYLAALLLATCDKASDVATTKPARVPIAVSVTPVRAVELQRSVRMVGQLTGFETATLSNRVTGVISKVYVDVGSIVKPNAKLLEIEPERFELAQHEAEGALQQTLARLGLKEIPAEDFDVNQTAPVKKAQSEYDNAKSKLDRATPLNQQKVMNDFEYLDIVSAFKTAESGLEASRDEARALVALARQVKVQIDLRKKDFQDSVILAPDGTTPDGQVIDTYVVTNRMVSVGEYLREGTMLFTVTADSTLKLQTRVPERYLAQIKKDAQVNFQVEAYADEAFQAKVFRVDPTVDPASRTFMVEALVDNLEYGKRLRPGSFVPGEILTQKDANCIIVPQTALSSFVGVTQIFKIAGDKVQAVHVTSGQDVPELIDGQKWVEVMAANHGIGPNDRVVDKDTSKLVDGSLITIKPAETPATAPTTLPN